MFITRNGEHSRPRLWKWFKKVASRLASGKVVEDSISCSLIGARRPHCGFRGSDVKLMPSANGHSVDRSLMSRMGHIAALVKQAAQESGFDLAGVAPVTDAPELAHFAPWIEAGRAGEMHYMKARDEQGRLKREALRNAAPWARSVIVCALNYNTSQPYSTQVNDRERGWISRYAWGREDYHDAVMRRLRVVEESLDRACGDPSRVLIRKSATETPPGTSQAVPALQTRCYVDTGPIVERVLAKYAGVGWIGKNTCIINQKVGSWLFLGVILTSLELEPDLPAADRCGSCSRCIDACPTHALLAPYQLDANKCISYLTIEKRGQIPQDLRSGMGQQVFGCDICQDVCPWNRKAPPTTANELEPRPELMNPALDWLAQINPEEVRRVFKRSPIRRAKRSGLRRNAVIAMGNSKNRGFLPLLEKLTKDEDETVADSAEWAAKTLLHSA